MVFDKIKKNPGIHDLTFLGSANIIGNGITAIFWFYLAALLGPEGYGEISYFLHGRGRSRQVFPLRHRA